MRAFLTFVAIGLGVSLLAQQPITVGVSSGTMFYFDQAAPCPTGWSEFTSARGLYITGLVNAGTKATAVLGAGAALTDQELRTHTHTMAHTHLLAGTFIGILAGGQPAETDGGGANVSDDHTHTWSNQSDASSAANTSTNNVTIAPYIQYLLCEKN
jgi:hypothetical protein